MRDKLVATPSARDPFRVKEGLHTSMRRGAVAALASLFVLACLQKPVAGSPTNDPKALVQFVGRFDFSDNDHPRFAWPASSIVARFIGPGLRVRLKDKGYSELQVVVDGAPLGVVMTNPQRDTYDVAAGLSNGPHDLMLVKRTEARLGEVQFLGFDPDAALVSSGQTSTRRIELIGDSITAGYGNEGPGVTCTGSMTALENEFLAYGGVAARILKAERVTLASSGRTTEEMSDLYGRTLPGHADSRWDFQKWTPDAVVINLGTNDFNHSDPGQAAFTRPYLALVERVRSLYPNAQIVCTLGPMLTDSYPPGVHALTRARAYISSVVGSLRAKGDTRISFLEFPMQDFANGLGCDYHPSLKTHRLMGEQLAAALRERLGW
jgi:lysophospholipase L1-like esterase